MSSSVRLLPSFSTIMVFDPCEVYRKCLSEIRNLGHGLWHPSTKINIGDVGYIDEGEFRFLFNVTDAAQLKKRECGDPLEYPREWKVVNKAYLKPDTYQSVSTNAVSVGGGPGV